MRSARVLVPLMCVALVGLIGCGGKGSKKVIVQKPQWDYKQFERLAVVPLVAHEGGGQDPRLAQTAGEIAGMVSDLLVQNGEFYIVSRRELANIMQEQDLALTDWVDPTTVMETGLIQVAEALVVVEVNDLEINDTVAEESRVRLRRTRSGRVVTRDGLPVLEEVKVRVYRRVARLGGSVRVIDAQTGQTVYAALSGGPLERVYENEGAPPQVSESEAMRDIKRRLAYDLYRQIAPTRVEVKFDKDSLLLAQDYYDGEYDKLKNVPVGLSQFLVVVRQLDEKCDDNDFRVTITEKDGRVDLFDSGPFTWNRGMDRRGIAFDVPTQVLLNAGAEEFTAKLYVVGDDRPAILRDFKLDMKGGGGDD